MASVLQLFAEMLRLRAAPQDLPARDGIVVGSVVAAAGAALLAIRSLYPLDMAAARIALDLVLQLAFVVAVLRLAGHPERFRQTFSALCGTGAILVLLTWPLNDILASRPPESGLAAGAVLLLFGIYGWSVLVAGHILRHALGLTLGRGVLVALGYIVVATFIAAVLVPPPGPA